MHSYLADGSQISTDIAMGGTGHHADLSLINITIQPNPVDYFFAAPRGVVEAYRGQGVWYVPELHCQNVFSVGTVGNANLNLKSTKPIRTKRSM